MTAEMGYFFPLGPSVLEPGFQGVLEGLEIPLGHEINWSPEHGGRLEVKLGSVCGYYPMRVNSYPSASSKLLTSEL